MGAEAGGRLGSDRACESFLALIGIAAEMAVLVVIGACEWVGGEETSEGVAMEAGKMKSSRFMGSALDAP